MPSAIFHLKWCLYLSCPNSKVERHWRRTKLRFVLLWWHSCELHIFIPQRHSIVLRDKQVALSPLTTDKEAPWIIGLFGYWRRHIPQQGTLLRHPYYIWPIKWGCLSVVRSFEHSSSNQKQFLNLGCFHLYVLWSNRCLNTKCEISGSKILLVISGLWALDKDFLQVLNGAHTQLETISRSLLTTGADNLNKGYTCLRHDIYILQCNQCFQVVANLENSTAKWK